MLYMTIGSPRSGKSTLAKQWLKYQLDICSTNTGYSFIKRINNFQQITNEESPRIVINEDDIRLALTGKRFTFKAEPMVHAISHTMIRAYKDYDILIDETHTTWKSIEELLWIYPDAIPVWIHKPNLYTKKEEWKQHIELCCQRAEETNQFDLIEVIKFRHAPQLEELSINFDDKFTSLVQKIKKEKK